MTNAIYDHHDELICSTCFYVGNRNCLSKSSWQVPDTRFAVTIDEIVQKASGFESDHEEFDLFFELNERIDQAIGDIADAKPEKLERNQIERLEQNLKTLRDTFTKANRIDLALRHELNNLRRDERSVLVIQFGDQHLVNPRFTTYSVYSWLQATFNITIQDWAPADAPPDADRDVNSEPDQIVSAPLAKPKRLREDKENGYQRVIEGLVLLLVKHGPENRYLLNRNPNRDSITADIIDVLDPHPRAEQVPSDRTVKRRLADSGIGLLVIPPRESK